MSAILVDLLLLFAALLTVTAFVIASFGFGILWGAPYVGTPTPIVRRMLLLAKAKEGETLLDLGSGTGSILLVGAREFGMHAIGYEINPILRVIARVRARLQGVADRIEVRSGNLFSVDLPKAEVVTIFLLPAMVERLKPKLSSEDFKGSRIIARDFHFKDWTPIAEDGWLRAYRPGGVL